MRSTSAADGTPDFTAASRQALVEALLSAGPGHPTLCEGWQTQHLAAHVHLRDSSPLAAGLLLPPLRARLERRTMKLGEVYSTPEAYQRLVDRVAAGPWGRAKRRGGVLLRRSRPVRRAAREINLLEFFVHTEDVRRAQDRWAPRHLADRYADVLFDQLRRVARPMYRKTSAGVDLVRSTGPTITARSRRRNEPSVKVIGPAGELVMHAFGRRHHALVVLDGPDDAVAGLAGN